jgi:hypothetical protein
MGNMNTARLAMLLIVLSTAACAPSFTSAGIGRYEEFQPFARAAGRGIDLELARSAHVAVVAVFRPRPAFSDRPLLFSAVYPYFESDRRYFDAGRHRLRARQADLRQPLLCGSQEVPTIEGCRRAYHMLPGVLSISDYFTDPGIRGGHYIVFAADEPIDPFSLAEELFYMALDRPELARRLRALDAVAAAGELERTLLDRPGTPLWAALYVAAR